MRKLIKSVVGALGFEIRRIRPGSRVPGGAGRPIGDVHLFLQDIRARGFVPRGIIDVGANQGRWTRMALSVFPNTPVVLIEPQQEMIEPLSALVRERPTCEYIAAGAGRTDGELVQTIWDDLAGSSFLPLVDAAALESGQQRRTPIVSIDGVLAQRLDFHPDLVKLDIQGFELEALSGAKTLFGRTEVFILETSLFQFLPGQPILREVVGFMAERDYEVYDVTEFLRRPCDGAVGQIDLAFVKTAGRFRSRSDW